MMFKTQKTRMLEEAMGSLKSATDGWAKSVVECEKAIQLAKDNAELQERAMRLVDHWRFMYESLAKQNASRTFTPELEARLDKAFLKACGITALDELPVN